MAITRVNFSQSAATFWAAGPFTSVPTAAQNITAGNLMVVLANNIPTSWTLSDTAGNTFIPIFRNTFAGNMWMVPNCKGNANNVITASGAAGSSFVFLVCVQYSGCDPVRPLDQFAANNSGTSTSPISAPISTRYPVEVLLGLVSSSDTSGSAGAGWTLITNPGVPPEVIEEMIVSSVQSNIAATATESASATWNVSIASFIGAGQTRVGSARVGTRFLTKITTPHEAELVSQRIQTEPRTKISGGGDS